MIAQHRFARMLHGRKQMRIAADIGDAQRKLSGLARAEHFAGAAQFEILLGDAETVAGFTQHIQTLTRHHRQRRLV